MGTGRRRMVRTGRRMAIKTIILRFCGDGGGIKLNRHICMRTHTHTHTADTVTTQEKRREWNSFLLQALFLLPLPLLVHWFHIVLSWHPHDLLPSPEEVSNEIEKKRRECRPSEL
jgi:ribosomal protein L32